MKKVRISYIDFHTTDGITFWFSNGRHTRYICWDSDEYYLEMLRFENENKCELENLYEMFEYDENNEMYVFTDKALKM